MMKHYYPAFAALCVLALIIQSCTRLLDQNDPNRVLVTEYFKTENDVFRALNGAYEALRDDYLLGEGNLDRTEERSDNTGRLDNGSSSGDPFQFTNFSLQSDNPFLRRHWVAHQVAISRANFVLLGTEEVAFADEELRQRYRAEALFLRGLVYFEAVRKWGDLPLVTMFLRTTDEVKEKAFRVSKKDIYLQIVKDLKEALEGPLDDLPSVDSQGRASKAAINGLLGKVLLTMYADPSLGADKDWLSEAVKYLGECWRMRPFGELTDIPYRSVFEVDVQDTCGEILFEIPYIRGDKVYHSSVARVNQPATSRLISRFNSKGEGRFVNRDLVKEYEPGDLRKEWSVRETPGSATKSYFISKYRDTSEGAGDLGYGGNDWILLRYGDVVLLLAEAEMYEGHTSRAVEYLDIVRRRAGLPGYEESLHDAEYAARYPTLRLAILHERRVELAFECQRWYDLLRLLSPDELVSYMHSKNGEDYGISDLHNFGPKDLLYPIPADEVKIDPKRMYQNPGY